MHYDEWKSLPEDVQERQSQRLEQGEDDDVFVGVRDAFLREYGNLAGMGPVLCGLGPFLGPYNCIVVNTKGRSLEQVLPKVFMGFPVIVEYL